MIKKYKIINFKPILFRKILKKIWQRYNFYLDFGKEWKNFLDICESNKTERIFSINNFLITEFLITNCELRSELLNSVNCYCNKTSGKIKIPIENYNKYKKLIEEFLINYNNPTQIYGSWPVDLEGKNFPKKFVRIK